MFLVVSTLSQPAGNHSVYRGAALLSGWPIQRLRVNCAISTTSLPAPPPVGVGGVRSKFFLIFWIAFNFKMIPDLGKKVQKYKELLYILNPNSPSVHTLHHCFIILSIYPYAHTHIILLLLLLFFPGSSER